MLQIRSTFQQTHHVGFTSWLVHTYSFCHVESNYLAFSNMSSSYEVYEWLTTCSSWECHSHRTYWKSCHYTFLCNSPSHISELWHQWTGKPSSITSTDWWMQEEASLYDTGIALRVNFLSPQPDTSRIKVSWFIYVRYSEANNLYLREFSLENQFCLQFWNHKHRTPAHPLFTHIQVWVDVIWDVQDL